jgi:hypothetical protein
MALLQVALFVVVVAVVVLMVYLLHFNAIRAEVRRSSRCLRLNDAHKEGVIETVTAVNDLGKPLYNITYNMDAKQATVDCACPTGNVINHFQGVPFYDLKQQVARKVEDKTCACDSSYDDVREDIFFEGVPGLVRFMQNADTSYFQKDPVYSVFAKPAVQMRVTANQASGGVEKPMYSVSYDFDALLKGSDPAYEAACACAPGDSPVKFQDIPVFNKGAKTTTSLACACDAPYPVAGSSVTYGGNRGLVAFMQDNKKTAVFTDLVDSKA